MEYRFELSALRTCRL